MWNAVRYSTIHCGPSSAFPSGYVAKRPLLKLALSSNDRIFWCYADVDSGADHCVFPMSFAAQLGLDPLTNPRMCYSAGLGNTQVPTYYWSVRMIFGATLSLDADVGFTAGMDAHGFGLLGQRGFFDQVKVMFDLPNGMFHIETPDPPQPC